MSLTSILGSSRYPHLKAWFREHFPNPGLGGKPPLLVPPTLDKGASTVGAAFDYLFRFQLERRAVAVVHTKSQWVADQGLAAILKQTTLAGDGEIGLGFHRDQLMLASELAEKATAFMAIAKLHYQQFLKDGLVTAPLIASALFLAKLDVTFRADMIDADLLEHDAQLVEDLFKLLAVVPWDAFRAEKHCILNPTFGKGSVLVGGADADVIVDHWLCDLKTTKTLSLDRQELNQVIGYYLLSLIGGVNGSPTPQIEEVGFYFARYGFVWKMNLGDLYSQAEWEGLAGAFVKLIQRSGLGF